MAGTSQFEAALKIIETLRERGYEAYLAGGCVRDLLLGREPADYDVATDATPDVVLEMFERTFAVGAHFGVVLVSTCGGADLLEESSGEGRETTKPVEVATFRSDLAYSDGRHPDGVRYTKTAEEDVRRRDFTINGLLLDPLKGFPQGLKPVSLAEDVNVRAEARTLHAEARTLDAEARALDAEARALHAEARTLQPEGSALHAETRTPHSEARTRLSGTRTLRAQARVEKATADPSLRLPHIRDANAGPQTRSAQDDSPEEARKNLRAAVIDYVGGVADLDAKLIRAIGRPELRFEEDRLRMLRAVRFAARFEFEIEPETMRAIRALAPRVHAVSKERVRDELTKMLTEGHARRAFELLYETGLLAEVLPEIARMKGVEQPPQYHPEGDVWIHTLLLLEQLEPGCSMTLAWGALLHDVGKPPTFRRASDRIRFDGHAEMGVAMGAEICRRFRFSNEETQQILALIENHMRFMDVQRMKESTLKRFFRLDRFEEHMALHRMDCMAGSKFLDHWNYVRERLATMPEAVVRPRPLITGRELIAAGYKPGEGFREMLRAAEDAQLEGTIATEEEALKLVRARFPRSREQASKGAREQGSGNSVCEDVR